MNARPLKSFVFVRELPQPTQTAGGIFLPQEVREPEFWFFVLDAGPGCESIRAGDTVWVHPDAKRREFREDGIEYLRVAEADILCIKR